MESFLYFRWKTSKKQTVWKTQQISVNMVDSREYYVGHWSLSEVRLMYPTFRNIILLSKHMPIHLRELTGSNVRVENSNVR